MKIRLLILLSIALSIGTSAQVVRFKSKSITTANEMRPVDWQQQKESLGRYKGFYHAVLQFRSAAGETEKAILKQAGISLIDYVPDNAYTVMIPAGINPQVFQQGKVRAVIPIPVDVKVSANLWNNTFPSYAVKETGTVDVLVSFNRFINVNEIKTALSKVGGRILDDQLKDYDVLSVRISQAKMKDVASLPFINYIQPLPPADKKLNDDVRANHKANLMHAPTSAGGEDLQGRGVVIGIGDNANLNTHIDLADRVIDRAAFLPETHGVHVAGTAAGAGILDPLYKGVAPMATLVAQVFGGIYKNATAYVADFGMVITNNSYGAITGECDYAGVYDLYSTVLDKQAFQLPELLHVFAAGNDGPFNTNCAFNGYHTTLGGYQSSKNILAVAWGDKDAKVSPGSSYGPTYDGRIKPEITATGSEVRSPAANNTYLTDWGSSMSAPAVAGGAALLVEKYRQLNAANPKSSLVKALLMNGAMDIETPGPDYKSGFGWMNLNRSVEMIKNNRYLHASVANNGINQHPVSIPTGTTHLKVMLYWHDPAAAVFAAKTLVNNLDLELVDPSTNTILPWRLDSGQVTAAATRGVDHLNNVEQVTIANPPAGNYIVRVKGTSVKVNATQEYVIVYDFMPAEIELTFPLTTEPLIPGETIFINWDAWDTSNNPFSLEFSADNGTTWTTISNAVDGNKINFIWTLPNVTTSEAKIRISRNGTSVSDESTPFVIMAQPAINLAANQCPTYTTIEWTAVPGATDYEVMMKKGAEMLPVAVVTGNAYTFTGLNKDSLYWFSVRPRINGKPGRRAVAVSGRPNTGNCSGNISDNDLHLDSILSPVTGRQFTSTEITTTALVVRIKNFDDAPVSNFDIKYSINGSAFTTQNVTATIPPLGHYDHSFSGLNFSTPGTYNIVAVVSKPGDVVAANDTLRQVVEHLPNPPVSSYIENFESAPAFVIEGSEMGLPGLPKWDLITSTPKGRARSFINSGFSLNGNRALTLDVSEYTQAGNTNYLVGTFNLSSYQFYFPDKIGLTFDFWFKNHGQQPSAENRIWARRSDTAQWIEVYNLDSAKSEWPGQWKYSGAIYLWKYIGMPTSSTQIRIGQQSVIGTSDNENFQGLTIDSFRLYPNSTDFGIVKINAPIQKGCGLSAAETLTVTTTGSKAKPTYVPFKYRLNGGPVITENFVGGIGTYSFADKLNLSAPGEYILDVWVDYPYDGNRTNDSIMGYKIHHQPVINSFPYLQNFENGTAFWYAEGHNSSWQFGTPSGIKINKAASGTNAWKTTLRGSYNDNELSYLYSPCFNTTSLNQPHLSFSLALDIEQCVQDLCDAAWLEFSLDGTTWQKLGTYGNGTNWYNRLGDNVWDSAGFRRWHAASIPLPGAAKLQLRFVMQSDGSLIKEGIAIDDVHVYDRQYPVYTDGFSTISAPVVHNLSGSGFVDFTSNGKVIASINPNGNNLGSTAVQAYIHLNAGFGGVRHINNQYYHDRNITIKPAQTIQPDSTTIRFYFTDAKTDSLVRANGCAGCTKPTDAYDLGITKYDDNDDTKENGTLADNTTGVYSFINKNKVVMVPYDIGYYAEFKVKSFSEFWLNNGGMDNNSALPLQINDFLVSKQGSDVLIKWTTTNEVNVDRYEVEVAKGNEAYSAGRFESIFQINAYNRPQNNYETIDAEPGKMGARYYRLKMIDKDGQVRYSDVKLVVFSTKEQWTIYPNPVTNVLNIVTQAEAGLKVEMQMLNATGQVVWQRANTASGMLDKLQIDLNQYKIAAGVYLLKIVAEEEVKHVKVVKQ